MILFTLKPLTHQLNLKKASGIDFLQSLKNFPQLLLNYCNFSSYSVLFRIESKCNQTNIRNRKEAELKIFQAIIQPRSPFFLIIF